MTCRPTRSRGRDAAYADLRAFREQAGNLRKIDRLVGNNGARGRGRTADTAIFSRMLYQLSYPGTGAERPVGLLASGGYRQGIGSCPEPLSR